MVEWRAATTPASLYVVGEVVLRLSCLSGAAIGDSTDRDNGCGRC